MNDGGLSLTVATPIGVAIQIGRMVVEAGGAVPPLLRDAPELVGRDGELSALRGLPATGVPGVVVSGPPGVGKTALARAWAGGRAGRVVHVDLRSGPGGAGGGLRRALRSLGVADPRMPDAMEDRRALLGSLLGPDAALVVDGARREDDVRALAPAGVAVVVTARRPLPGLIVDGWADLPLAGLDTAAGLALLDAGGHLGWDAADPAVAAVIRHCAGRPRALVQLARPARAHGSPEALLAALATAAPAELARGHLGPSTLALLDRLAGSGVTDVDDATATALHGGPCAPELAELAEVALLDAVPGGGWRLVEPAAEPAPDGVAVAPDAAPDIARIAVAAADALARAGARGGEAAVRMDIALHELGAGRPSGAVEQATRAALAFDAVGDHDGSARAALLIGRALLALGEAAAALDCVDAVLGRLPPGHDRSVAQACRGDALALLGRSGAATQAFERATAGGARGPAGARAWRGIAEARLRAGDRPGALAAYRSAVRALGPTADPRLLALLGEEVEVRLETPVPAALRSLATPLGEVGGEVGAILRGIAALTGGDLLTLMEPPLLP